MNLLATSDLNKGATDVYHGQMITIIRFKTSYIINGKGPLILLFALNNDDRFRSILGSPMPLAMSTAIDLVSGLLSCVELNRTFPLELHLLGKDFPNGTNLNHCLPIIPLSVFTNTTFNNYILHCTSIEGASHSLYLSTSSNNILVPDHFSKVIFHGSCHIFLPSLLWLPVKN